MVDPGRIAQAEDKLDRLVGREQIAGRRILDLGCGSGLHSLAALRLGAKEVIAIDIDQESVETARHLLSEQAPGLAWHVEKLSIFDITPERFSTFDIVYSWGVLHHTGAMIEAIERAAVLPAPGGLLALALYHKTPFCSLWRRIKRWYASATPTAQGRAQALYIGLMRFGYWLTRQDFCAYVDSYGQQRGMDFRHDVHDWLGGYPYESIAPKEVAALMARLGYDPVRLLLAPSGLGFSAGCDEFLYRRRAPKP